MKKIRNLQNHEIAVPTSRERRVFEQAEQILNRIHDSSRSVVKSALREIRDFNNFVNRNIRRSNVVDQQIRNRRDELEKVVYWLAGYRL